MRTRNLAGGAVLTLAATAAGLSLQNRSPGLPAVRTSGGMPLTDALAARRSCREFSAVPLSRAEIGQLCWAAQGITDSGSARRAAPSAGALYPLELYVATAGGVEHYRPRGHVLEPHLSQDVRAALAHAALDQRAVAEAPACVILTAVEARTQAKYGTRAERYCFLEAGHAAQNLLLQATALDLGGVPVGAFEDEQVAAALHLPPGTRPLYLLPVGHPE